MSTKMETNDDPSESERMRKLFLGGLSFATTEDDIRDTFSKFGTIVDCVVIRDSNRRDDPTPPRSRGFGFVTFETAEETNNVLAARKKEKIKMNGRDIDIKRAMAREDSEKDPTVNEETRKIYIYGIGSLRDGDLRDYFQTHGEVKDVIIPKQNADPTKIRGFAFVEFSDPDIVDTLVAMKTHTIAGVTLEVKKATPQIKGGRDRGGGGMGDRQRGGYDGGFGQRGYGGNFGGPGGYGGGGFGGSGFGGGGGYGGGGNRGFAEERFGRNPRDSYGGGGGYNDGYGRHSGYDDSYTGGGYSRGFGGSGGGYRGDGFGGGYGSGGHIDDYGSQGSSFGPVRGGGRSSGGGGGGPYGATYGSGNYNRYGGGGGGGGGRRY